MPVGELNIIAALLYIHRSFFAQAMLDHPANPLRSPYAPSFLAAYRCASGVIKSGLNHFDRFPDLCGRWWGVWTHCRHTSLNAEIEELTYLLQCSLLLSL